jgi:hypothetical protein
MRSKKDRTQQAKDLAFGLVMVDEARWTYLIVKGVRQTSKPHVCVRERPTPSHEKTERTTLLGAVRVQKSISRALSITCDYNMCV